MTDPKAIPLLPCPFCGEAASIDDVDARGIGASYSEVGCDRCGARIPQTDVGETYADLANLWNTRPTQADGLRVGLERALEIVRKCERAEVEQNGKMSAGFAWACDRITLGINNAIGETHANPGDLMAKYMADPEVRKALHEAESAALSAPASEGREVECPHCNMRGTPMPYEQVVECGNCGRAIPPTPAATDPTRLKTGTDTINALRKRIEGALGPEFGPGFVVVSKADLSALLDDVEGARQLSQRGRE